MNHPSTLTETDVSRIIALLSEVSTVPQDKLIDRKQHLLDGLSEIISANKWLWALRSHSAPETAPAFTSYLYQGFTDEELSSITASSMHPDIQAIDAPYREELLKENCHLTRRLEDFDTQGLWAKSPASELARQAGVGTFMASTRPLGDLSASVVALYRSPEAELFTERDRQIAHIVLSNVTWLHIEGLPQGETLEHISSLNRSQLSVLGLLVRGLSRNEIAKLRDLSLHTVNSYCKVIFNYFQVNSQTELMRSVLFGDDQQ